MKPSQQTQAPVHEAMVLLAQLVEGTRPQKALAWKHAKVLLARHRKPSPANVELLRAAQRERDPAIKHRKR